MLLYAPTPTRSQPQPYSPWNNLGPSHLYSTLKFTWHDSGSPEPALSAVADAQGCVPRSKGSLRCHHIALGLPHISFSFSFCPLPSFLLPFPLHAESGVTVLRKVTFWGVRSEHQDRSAHTSLPLAGSHLTCLMRTCPALATVQGILCTRPGVSGEEEPLSPWVFPPKPLYPPRRLRQGFLALP